MANEISNQVFASAPLSPPAFPADQAKPHTPLHHLAETSVPGSTSLPLDQVKKMVSEMSDVTQAMNKGLKFEVDLKNHDIIVKVIDPSTDKVIREIPPAELQTLHQSLREAVGHLINKLI